MKLSLIISTLGRTDCFERLFDTLRAQTFQDFELILVDQNSDDRLIPIIEEFGTDLKITHVPTPSDRGLSRGRNKGIAMASGEVVLFPDDDCWYPDDFLERGLALMESTSADIVTGRAAKETGESINGRFEIEAQEISRENVWTTQIEWVCFFKLSTLKALSGYDENIGIGASSPWQACEGQEIVLRALAADFKAYYSPDLFGHHEELDTRAPDAAMRKKGLGYARGLGRVLRMHNFGIGTALYWAARPAANAVINMCRLRVPRARYLAQVSIGRIQGYFSSAR